MDNAAAPVFLNEVPIKFVDLSSDGVPETFSAHGHYSVLTPVASIKSSNTYCRVTSVYKTIYSEFTSGDYTYKCEKDGTLLPGETKPYIYNPASNSYVLYVTGKCGTGVSLPYSTAIVYHMDPKILNKNMKVVVPK